MRTTHTTSATVNQELISAIEKGNVTVKQVNKPKALYYSIALLTGLTVLIIALNSLGLIPKD